MICMNDFLLYNSFCVILWSGNGNIRVDTLAIIVFVVLQSWQTLTVFLSWLDHILRTPSIAFFYLKNKNIFIDMYLLIFFWQGKK